MTLNDSMPRNATLAHASAATTIYGYTSILVPVVDFRPVAPTAAPESAIAVNPGEIMNRNPSQEPSSEACSVFLDPYSDVSLKFGRLRMSFSLLVWAYTIYPR